MENEGNLSEILNETGPQPDLNPEEPESVAEEEAPEKEAEPEAKEPEQKAEDTAEPEKGEKQPDATPAPAEEKQELPTVPIASLQDERRKRQELERRLAAMEQKREPEPVPDVIEDPEAFVAHQDQKRQKERLQDRVAISEEIVRTSVGEEEYAKAEAAFMDEVANNPSLAAEAMRAQNPAMFMYKTGKSAMERQEIGDPREFAAKQVEKALEAQKAKMAEEIQKQVQEQVAKLVPKSLADDASAAARTSQTPVDDVDVPIDQILK